MADNPKSELINFLQRHCGKTLTKGDVTWTTSSGEGAFQCIVKMVCLTGQEFAGDVATSEKEAEKAAARVALEAFAAEIAALPPPAKKKKSKSSAAAAGGAEFDPTDNVMQLQRLAAGLNGGGGPVDEASNFKNQLIQAMQAHCKRPMAKGDIAYEHNRIGDHVQATCTLNCVGGMSFAGEPCSDNKASDQSAAQQALLACDSWNPPVDAPMVGEVKQQNVAAGGAAGDPVHQPKSELVIFLQGYFKKPVTKGDVVYTSTQADGLTQSIVTVIPMNGQQFAGEPCKTQKEAETSAAEQALAAYASLAASVPAMAKLAQKRQAAGLSGAAPGILGQPPLKRPRGAQIGNVARIMPVIGGMAAGGIRQLGAKAPVQPGPRTPVLTSPVTGEVTEWNAKMSFGYIKPHEPIGHPKEAQRKGKIYVHKQDLSNAAALAVGSMVQFTVYSDSKGLGCADVMQF